MVPELTVKLSQATNAPGVGAPPPGAIRFTEIYRIRRSFTKLLPGSGHGSSR